MNIFAKRLNSRSVIIKIHDDKKRERLYTLRKTILDIEVLISMLPNLDKNKFNLALDALKQKEVIEITGDEAKIFFIFFIKHSKFIIPSRSLLFII